VLPDNHVRLVTNAKSFIRSRSTARPLAANPIQSTCMRILLVDTCGPTGTIALASTDRSPSIVAEIELPGRAASERLIAVIRDLTSCHQFDLATLDALVVVSGPGSFTGVRVGLSAAKGLCEALAVPLIGISRLAVLANKVDVSPGGSLRAVLDAGRGEFYSGTYTCAAAPYELLLSRQELLTSVADANSTGAPQFVIACEPSVTAALSELRPQLIPEPIAADALELALRRIRDRSFDDPAALDANYLRRTDAQLFAKPAQAPTAPR
jgi:tRNA threonylcarbamoyladenosine biosynthesis protein TsaB